MTNLYNDIIEKVEHGSRFNINFQKRTLKVDGKNIALDGERDFGVEIPDNPIPKIEELYFLYRNSIPSERSDKKAKTYFQALPESKLSDEAMLYGMLREHAQIRLELFVLFAILQDKLQWDRFAEGKWFWQSSNQPSLIILKNWIINN